MSHQAFFKRYTLRGVFWRELLEWVCKHMPYYIEPLLLVLWNSLFFIFWPPGRRAVAANLRAIFPDDNFLTRQARVYRVFWNFACTFTDTFRHQAAGRPMDWEVTGSEYLDQLASSREGAILLTAHMGNYDLGAYLFAKKLGRPLAMVRVPERDPATESFALERRDRLASDGVKVNYNLDPGAIVLDLVESLQNGEVVAIQGDRVLPGVTPFPVTLFGQSTELPSGPFALALATRVLIYPMFVIRVRRRRYRVIASEPIRCERTSRDRNADIEGALSEWRRRLESTIREHWWQWHTFEPFMKEGLK